MKVSLIIPTYGRERLLVQTLQCALKQDTPDYEIIVLDQTAKHEPETEQFLRDCADRITLIRLDQPSVTKARNVGIKRAAGEIIVFVDDDVSFEPSFLSEHLKAHEAGADVVAGRTLETGCRIAATPPWLSDSIRYSGSNTCATPGKTNVTTGCNFSISRRVVETIGEFDERFQGLATCEDDDYGFRAYRAGLNVRFVPEACLFHHRSPSGGVGGGIRNQFFDPSYYRCELLFARKHFSKRTVRIYKFRLFLRGLQQLRKLISAADKSTQEVLK